MALLKNGFIFRGIYFTENVIRRAQALQAQRSQSRGAACTLSELVNESMHATLPQVDDEGPIVAIKKTKLRSAGRLKQSA